MGFSTEKDCKTTVRTLAFSLFPQHISFCQNIHCQCSFFGFYRYKNTSAWDSKQVCKYTPTVCGPTSFISSHKKNSLQIHVNVNKSFGAKYRPSLQMSSRSLSSTVL